MSAPWRIEPEPTEEELAALMAAIVATLRAAAKPELKPMPTSRWMRAARREAINARTDREGCWNE